MSLPVRLGLYYAAIFVGVGASSPYMPVWFASRGLSGAQIGLILSLPLLARVVVAPLIAVWADSFRTRRTPLILMGTGVAALYALLALPWGFAWWAVVWFAMSSTFTTMPPLADALVLKRAARDGFNYGWPRGIGSAAFVVANITVGWLLARGSPEIVLVWVVGAASLMAIGARVLLPPDPVHEEGGPARLSDRLAGLGSLVRDPAFMTAILAAGLIQAGHAFYYSFSTLAWKQQGIAESTTGVLWATGVIAEIAFLWFMEPWRRALGPVRLLILGGAGAVVRWTIYAFSPPLALLFPLQRLHTLSYAATFLASIELCARLAGGRNASAAQTLNSSVSSGVLAGLATLASGWLFDAYGARGYLLMAALSAVGLLLAVRLAGMVRERG